MTASYDAGDRQVVIAVRDTGVGIPSTIRQRCSRISSAGFVSGAAMAAPAWACRSAAAWRTFSAARSSSRARLCGSTFTLRLPKGRRKMSPAPPRGHAASRWCWSSRTIRMPARYALRTCSSPASGRGSGQRHRGHREDAGIAARHRVDGPGAAADGCWEATRRLKNDERTRHIPIVALTGHALAGHAEGARAAGCDAFVTKPCLPDALVAEIRRLLDHHRGKADNTGDPAQPRNPPGSEPEPRAHYGEDRAEASLQVHGEACPEGRAAGQGGRSACRTSPGSGPPACRRGKLERVKVLPEARRRHGRASMSTVSSARSSR